ncbi:DNA phosphorothioation-dependent restriction protein DptH [Pseudoalteromonas sp. SR43-7]|uniref:DNA phosphorothioation-dependent restriction protein DptH n=1 Tax=Pseudoalteromonas sp. SR43-7 TaxID=2760939 RepID=UPI0015F8623D|nr:DNA phosphorothioation-dependent restriction protein DptH [Pseudoalteromonas sp. SR43-7]MBB1330884.1 DNA phosphorothioation-dependent restriction protein DptH [Pseudoalteromonas sp. SR43-7]
MQYMLEKQFEDFLVSHFNVWAAEELKVGFRYQFTSPDSDKGYALYQAFMKIADNSVTVKGIELKTVQYGDVELIPVYEGENFTENYIAHLRDVVSAMEGETKGTALLIIHNSMLDTLKNSTEDVAQPGVVWDPKNIKLLLHKEIDQTDEKAKVSECLLDYHFDEIVEDEATMFGFEKLYYAIADGDLQFHELGLLKDDQLSQEGWEGDQISLRLKENKELSDKLDFITHHFPNELQDKLATLDFSEKFIKEHFPEGNVEKYKESLDIGECFTEQQKNRTNLLELESEKAPYIELLAKAKSEKGAGVRERHLILVLEPEQHTFELELCFINQKLKDSFCKIQQSKELPNVDITIKNPGGIRSRAVLTSSFDGQARYFNFRVKTDKPKETHNFKVLVISKNDFYIDGFKHTYLVDPAKQWLTLQTDEQSLQISDLTNTNVLAENNQVFDSNAVGIVDFKKLATESDEINFTVQGAISQLTFNVEGEVSTDTLSLPLLLDQGRFNHLFNDEYFGQFNRSKNKVLIDGKEVAPKAKRLTLLQNEAELLDSLTLAKLANSNDIKLRDLESHYADLYFTYRDLFDYLAHTKSLLSLSGWGKKLRALATQVVEIYQTAIDEIPYHAPLLEQHKLLVNIGFADFDEQTYITPYHPLVLAYNCNLADVLSKDKDATGSFKKLPPVTIQRLTAQGLLPFVYDPVHDFSYNHAEKENVFWSKLVPQQESSYDFVRTLVKDKVGKFTTAFKHLFVAASKTTLIINSVNNQQNKELFLGLIDYIKLKKNKVTNIHVNLYDEAQCYTWFDRFADMASYDDLKELCELNKGAAREQADSIIDLLRTRLTYSKFEHEKGQKEQHYAHMSFFKNNERVQATDVDLLKQETGVVCHGLMPGESASNKNGSYYTSFGLKGIDVDSAPQLKLVAKYSGLIKPAKRHHEEYSESKSQALVVTENFKTLLERSYENSIWTTIIDPKVTLEFFENQKNMVLIHYSDNYTNSVNYDAITVTKQTDLYHKVLENDEGGIIEEFNAFNGEWLLNLVTANDNERKEKRGIICAYKYVNCLVADSDITWVPLSIAEVIRVAGNLGLNMADSDLSRHAQGFKKGVISDDILFVGFKGQQMILLPVEVKTGKRQTHSKGVEQAKELKQYFEALLGQQTLAGHLYRGLFMRQVLMQIDKYKLYKVYKEGYFNSIEQRSAQWLQGDYELAELLDYPAGFLFVNVEDDNFTKASFLKVHNILKVELPAGNLSHWVKTPMQNLLADLTPAKLHHIDAQYILTKSATTQKVVLEQNVKADEQTELTKTQGTKITALDDVSASNNDSKRAEQANPTEVKEANTNNLVVAALSSRKKMSESDLSDIYQQIIDCYYSHNITLLKPDNVEPYIEGPASILFRVGLNLGDKPESVFAKSQSLKLALKLEQEQDVGFGIDKGCITIDVPKSQEQRYFVDQNDIWPNWQRPQNALEVPLGEDRFGEVIKLNFSSSNCPHLLIGGTTGSGKSEALNTILYGMVEHYTPSELKLMLIDPKGTELNDFERYSHLIGRIGFDDEDALELLTQAVAEMQSRYAQFKAQGVRSLPDYNAKVTAEDRIPWWVLVLDEYADLTSDKDMKKDIEAQLKRLAQKARAAGIHLIIATQKPSGDVISTNLRSNLPAQLALRVKNGTESRVILDEQGAEVLNGKGDAYLKSEGKLVRIQCARVNF